jgi:type II secretory pathway predicted ATPase ExeA
MNPPPWLSHFDLVRTPFSKSIPTDQLFLRPGLEQALARIHFCLQESAIGCLIGDVGVGKTVAVRAVMDALDPTQFQRLYVADPGFGVRGIYVTLVSALGAQPRFHLAELIGQTQNLLAAEHLERHRQVFLCVDEAQMLTPAQLQVLRLLTSAELDSRSYLTLLLVGQPMLAHRLRMGDFASLDQRILARYTLPPMDLAESLLYLKHQLAVAGRTQPLFADDAVARLHQAANGLPRSLNNLALAALMAAAAENKDLVDDACAKRAVAEFTRDNLSQPPS